MKCTLAPHLCALVALLTPLAAHADPTVAGAAFDRATELEKQGKWAEACPLYETSYRADPQIGVLLHLAICHEQVGQLASAWTEFNDAADLAHSRQDPREQTARDRATALAPRLAKIYLAAPSAPIAGLIVRRDGIEITALIGTTMPIDPGEHELVMSAPGYIDWHTKITTKPQTTTPVDLPLLQKAPEAAPKLHEGMLTVTTQADAAIFLDQRQVGVGHYMGKVKSGGHTLRVTAPHKRTYQNEVVLADDEPRAIEVPLDPDIATTTIVVAPEDLPAGELGVHIASGVKLHGDKPAIVATRFEAAFRFGRRVNFGVYVEYGSLSTGNACGFEMPGAVPASPFDFGVRNQFTNCTYVTPGLQLYIHILPKHTFDPYVGISPGFRFGFTSWTPFVDGMAGTPRTELFPAIVSGARVGLDYHPLVDYAALQVGAFFETAITIVGQEGSHDGGNHNDGATFVSLLGGLRSTWTF